MFKSFWKWLTRVSRNEPSRPRPRFLPRLLVLPGAGAASFSVPPPRPIIPLGTEQLEVRIVPAPVVSGLSQNSGPTSGGGGIDIFGSDFTGVSAVAFGSASAEYMPMSDTEVYAIPPSHAAGVVDVAVTTPDGTSSAVSADQYTYVAPVPPAVTGISPGNGPMSGGTEVDLFGSGFTNATGVDFGTSYAMYSVLSDNEMAAWSPMNAGGAVDITVSTPNGTSPTSAADVFIYNPSASATLLTSSASPSSYGDSVTLTATVGMRGPADSTRRRGR